MKLENLSQYLQFQKDPSNYRKYFIVGAAVVLLSILGYVFLSHSDNQSSRQAASYVPADALLVVESSNLKEFWNQSKELEAWKNLSQIPYFEKLNQKAHLLLDSLDGSGWRISQFLQNKNVLSSLHLTANGDYDYLFFVPFERIEEDFIQKLLERIAQQKNSRIEKREYQGQQIQEINDEKNDLSFSCIFYDGYFIASFTPLLIEDVIRTTTGSNSENFYSLNQTIFEETPDKNLHLYFNFKKMPDLLSIFVPDSLKNDILPLSKIATNWYTEADFSDRQLRLEGHIFDDDQNSDFLPIFEDQLPTDASGLYEFVPKRTAALLRWGFSDSPKFRENLHEYLLLHNPDFEKVSQQLKNDWRFETDKLFEQVYEEIAFAWVESAEGNTSERLIWLKLQNPTQIVGMMKQLALNTQDSITFETYGDLKITKISVDNFPKALFGDLAAGFRTTYYTIINNYLILANSPQAIRNLGDDLEKREVWGKLNAQSLFVNRIDKASNISFNINLLRSWTMLNHYLEGSWQEIFDQYKRQILRFEFLNFQIKNDDQQMRATLSLQHKQAKKLQGGSIQDIYSTALSFPISSKPYIVQNHFTKTNEVFVQDDHHQLYLISNEGDRRWKTDLGKKLISPIYQVDLFKNEKIQYLFATDQKIFLYDRLGRSVTNFPIQQQWKSPLDKFSVIDFDNSRNYRFVAADQTGNLYMFSKSATPIKEWNPRKLIGKLAHSVGHIRTGSQDYVLAIQQNGLINAIRPNSDTFKGFPISLNVNLNSPYFLRYNDQPENSTLTVLSRAGEIIRLNLKGQVLQRQELDFTDRTDFFSMAIDEAEGDNWVAVRQDQDGSVGVFGSDGKKWFEKNFSDNSPKIVQYFSFGANAEIICLTDQKSRKTFLYYPDGESVYQGFFDSDHAVSVLYNESQEEFLLYSSFANKVKLTRVAKN